MCGVVVVGRAPRRSWFVVQEILVADLTGIMTTPWKYSGQSSRRGVDAARSKSLTSVAAPQPSAACTRLHREDTRVVIWISLVLEPNTPGDTRGSRAGRAAGDRDGSGDRSNPTHANTGRPSVNREHSSGARSPSPVLSPRGNGIACRNATPEG